MRFSAPDDHFTAGPDCRVIASGRGRVGRAGGCPTICAGIVSPASVQKARSRSSAPDDHFTAGPDCRVNDRAVGALVVLVAVQLSVLGLYLPPVFEPRSDHSTPNDHFIAGPDCRVTVSGRGRVGRAGGCPTIRAGIVSPASVQRRLRSDPPPQTIISLPVQTAV